MTGASVSRLGVVDETGRGTPAARWRAWPAVWPELDVQDWREVVVVAPHPDDEALGAGGLIARLVAQGSQVTVVSVTDGEGARPPDSVTQEQLADLRVKESARGCAMLGVAAPLRVGLPDGRVCDHEGRLADLIEALLTPTSVCVASWEHDAHPDHEAVGRAAAVAASRAGARHAAYPVWMWHWSSPDDPAVPWSRARVLSLTPAELATKTSAVRCHQTQIEPPAPGVSPVLPDFVIERLLSSKEMLLL